MNYRIIISFIFYAALVVLSTGCTQEAPVTAKKPVVTQPQKTKPALKSTPTKTAAERKLSQQMGINGQEKIIANFVPCKTNNKTLPENTIGLPLQNVTAFIGANDSTLDKELGESHRVFEVKSGPNCEMMFSQNLPINVSADFPYYLSKDACNESLGLIGIRGFHEAKVFNIYARQLMPDLKPKFLTEREAADATSGMISNLFFDENFLYGYAVDFGVFVFDLKQNGSPLLPIAEFSETQLFGLNRGNNQVDIFIPILNFKEDGTLDLQMKNIFDRPIRINPALKFKFNNGKYILFKEKMGAGPTNHLVVDMIKKERLELPKGVAQSSIKEVMSYLK